jgi:uncharacterized cupin superfamily protein
VNEVNPIINIDAAELKPGGNASKFVNRTARLAPKIGLRTLGCSVVVVPPGKRGFPYHAHSLIEEMCFVLEGTGTLRHEGVEYPVRAGDLIASPCGTAHQLVNTSESDLKYLAMSSNSLADVVLYHDSGKVGAVSGAFPKTLWHFSKLNSPAEYYEGEE